MRTLSVVLDTEKPTKIFPNDYAKDIEQTLDWLTRFAIAIRKAGTRYRDIRAEDFAKKDPRILDLREETLNVLEYIRISFYLGKEVPMAVPDPPMSESLKRLHDRLVECNAKRRSRFLYAARHDRKLGVAPLPAQERTLPQKCPVPEPSNKPKEPLPQPASSVGASEAKQVSKSVISSQRSTAATRIDPAEYTPPSNQRPNDELYSSGPEIAGTFVTGKVKMIYPSPPKVDASSNFFQCPCCRQLVSREVTGKSLWRYAHITDAIHIKITNYIDGE